MAIDIIVSGNKNYGLGESFAKRWTDAVFWSRSTNGKDLLQQEQQFEFAKQSLKHNIYISCSSLHHFAQLTLLEKVVDQWISHRKSGYIFVLGSMADATTKGNAKLYASEKKALRNYCRQISLMIQGLQDPPLFKICYLSLGHLNTPAKMQKHGNVPHLEGDDVVNAIEWILQLPSHLFIGELTMAAIGARCKT